MKNLPVFTQGLLKGCKVFAIVGALSLCCACGGSQPSNNPGGDVSASPISGEVEVKGDEVASSSGEATAAEPASTEQAAADAGTENNETADTPSEVADNNSAPSAQAEKPKESADKAPTGRVMAGGKLRDPFDKFFGAPAIGTSLAGGVKPSTDKGHQGINPAYARKLAAKKAQETPKPVVKVSKPDVKVTGILRSGSSYKAILQGPQKAIMVSSGETIGGYRIAAVTEKDVTLVYKGKYKFVIPLEKEVFGSTGIPSADAGKMTNNDGVAAPVIEVAR